MLGNLRLLRGDAVLALRDHVAPGSLAGTLVAPETVALMASRLAPGATLHLATDIAEYAEVMRRVTAAEERLRNPHGGFAPRPPWRPRTKFEVRAQREGRPSHDLLLVRVDGPAEDPPGAVPGPGRA